MSKFQATYAKIGNSSYILGKDAFSLAGVFPKAEQVRPIVNGLINSAENDSIELLLSFIRKLLSKAPVTITDVVFTLPAPSVANIDSTYHRQVVEYLMEQLNINCLAVYDVHASAYTLLSDENMTGINVECGYNVTSICFNYLNVPAITFSIPFGTQFLEDSICRDLSVTARDARKFIEQYNEKDQLPVSKMLAVKAGMDRFVEEFLYKLRSALDSRKSNLITYDDPIVLALSGGAFVNSRICDELSEGITQIIQSVSLNKIKEVQVSPNPQWSAASGAFMLATSDIQEVTTEQPITQEVLEPLKLDTEIPETPQEDQQPVVLSVPSAQEHLQIEQESIEVLPKANVTPQSEEEISEDQVEVKPDKKSKAAS
ncbi:hypothetical protein [Yersinia ruckeri]|uniref:hypothetical protein n=1 Tax=Yersinia ruckeri TaxID=29486 RepID=UPI002237BC01|nr:hypothetical protein [Yersinia ruckeri]MCW6598693.1 hypothetical protein [Yersinia ruckeri]